MNQILRLPVLKYTHREKKNKLKIKQKQKNKTKQKNPPKTKQHHPPSPRKKRGQPQHPRRSSLRQQSRNRAVNCCRKDPHP